VPSTDPMNALEYILRSVSSFRSKQRLVIMLACSIVLVATLVCFLAYSFISFNQESRERLGALGDIIGADIGAALSFGDEQAIAKSLESLRADPAVKQLFVLNDQGQISAYYNQKMKDPPADLQQRLEILRSETTQQVFELSPGVGRTIKWGGMSLGTILVEQDESVITRKISASAGISVFILLFALGFSYLLANRFQRVITEPVQSLVATMEEVTRTKNYHVRSDVHGLTELSLLSEGFNEMLGEISRRDEAILESEYRWKFALEGAGDGVWDWDIQTGEISYSQRCKEMLGYAEGDILPDNHEWVDRVHPDDRSYLIDSKQSYLDGRTETYVVEYRLRCKDDSYIWILDRGMVVCRSDDGRPLRMIGTYSDITERKQVEVELRKKNVEIEQFLYTVSHDLRTPLVTVKTFLGFLENDMAGGDQQKISQDLLFIHGAADKMKLMLDELLELSRIDRVESKAVKVSFGDVICGVLEVMAGTINERRVEIHHSETDLMLFGDPLRLSQIWQNLIENAIKYSRDDSTPRIKLGSLQENGETIFFVTDNGIGIDPRYCTKVFGIFEKLNPKSPGAGLGLSMVQRIVEKFGGRIWVESNGSDQGSNFYFTLPNVMVLDEP
jgi:PAS domain S-box-containing protein